MLEIRYKNEFKKIMAEAEEASTNLSDDKNIPFCQQIKRQGYVPIPNIENPTERDIEYILDLIGYRRDGYGIIKEKYPGRSLFQMTSTTIDLDGNKKTLYETNPPIIQPGQEVFTILLRYHNLWAPFSRLNISAVKLSR